MRKTAKKNDQVQLDICPRSFGVSGIMNIQEIVHYDLQELKQKSTKNFQNTDSLIKEYGELKQMF